MMKVTSFMLMANLMAEEVHDFSFKTEAFQLSHVQSRHCPKAEWKL
jgi:hypothetical protein